MSRPNSVCTVYFYTPSSTLLYASELLLFAAYQKCRGDCETVTLLLLDVPVFFNFFLGFFRSVFQLPHIAIANSIAPFEFFAGDEFQR